MTTAVHPLGPKEKDPLFLIKPQAFSYSCQHSYDDYYFDGNSLWLSNGHQVFHERVFNQACAMNGVTTPLITSLEHKHGFGLDLPYNCRVTKFVVGF